LLSASVAVQIEHNELFHPSRDWGMEISNKVMDRAVTRAHADHGRRHHIALDAEVVDAIVLHLARLRCTPECAACPWHRL